MANVVEETFKHIDAIPNYEINTVDDVVEFDHISELKDSLVDIESIVKELESFELH